MDEYITRNNVISAVCFGCNQEFSDDPCEPDCCAIRQAIKNITTSAVVPKSEVEELSGKYEDLKLKYAELQKDKDELIAWGNDKKTEVKLDFTEEEIMRSLREAGIEVSDKSISEIKADVAREIFEEIEKYSEVAHWNGLLVNPVLCIGVGTLAELKKKYTEEKT